MPPNGPAIKGGCVTRRPSGQLSSFFSQGAITVGAEGMARVFALPDCVSQAGVQVAIWLIR